MKHTISFLLVLTLLASVLLSGCGNSLEKVKLDNNDPFDLYSSPVFALECFGADGIGAQRTVTVKPGADSWEVTDVYVLSNETAEQVTALAAYPRSCGANWQVNMAVDSVVTDYDVLYGATAVSDATDRLAYTKLLQSDSLSAEFVEEGMKLTEDAAKKRAYVYRFSAEQMPENPNDLKNAVGVTISYNKETTHLYFDEGTMQDDTIIFPYHTGVCGTLIAVGDPIDSFSATGYYDGKPNRWDPKVTSKDWFLLLGEEMENYYTIDHSAISFTEEGVLAKSRAAAMEKVQRRAALYCMAARPDFGHALEDLLPSNLEDSQCGLYYCCKELSIPAKGSTTVSFNYTISPCLDESEETGVLLGSGIDICMRNSGSLALLGQSVLISTPNAEWIRSETQLQNGVRYPAGERCYLYQINSEVAAFADAEK